MTLDTALKPQKTSQRVRDVGINPNHWYPVAWADRLKRGETHRAVVWKEEILIYRGQSGALRATTDACLHKGVALHKGDVERDCIVCPYHGWRFDGDGACVAIPYLAPDRPLPTRRLRTYPVQERYNIVWVFPGDPDRAAATPLPEVPEYDDPAWLIVQIPAAFKVHFSMVNENPLDVFHGHLHRDLQGWHSPVLTDLSADEGSVRASYDITFPNGRLTRLLGLSESKEPEVRRRIDVGYYYPHCRNTMPGISNYYFMRQPVGPDETKSFGLICLRVRLPGWFVRRTRRPLSWLVWRFIVKPFLDQDVMVMESEQRNFRRDPTRPTVEINPVIAAAQRLTVAQADAAAATVTLPDGAGGGT